MKKGIGKLDIKIPILSPKIYRDYKNISELDTRKFEHKKSNLSSLAKREKEKLSLGSFNRTGLYMGQYYSVKK